MARTPENRARQRTCECTVLARQTASGSSGWKLQHIGAILTRHFRVAYNPEVDNFT
jgi:hypothetical protein